MNYALSITLGGARLCLNTIIQKGFEARQRHMAQRFQKSYEYVLSISRKYRISTGPNLSYFYLRNKSQSARDVHHRLPAAEPTPWRRTRRRTRRRTWRRTWPLGARAARALIATPPPPPPLSLRSWRYAEMGTQLGSPVAFGSYSGKALPGVPRKAPLCSY